MSNQAKTSVTLYQGVPHACSYLTDEITTLHIVDPDFSMTSGFYEALLTQGFRRSGDMVYRPGCETCHACIPVRIPVESFSPSRSQRRCLQRNSDLRMEVRELTHFEDHHFDLYTRYLQARHADGDMVYHTSDDMDRFLKCRWGETDLIEGWLDDQLVMVAVTDTTPNTCSALYTFFDPVHEKRSLGTYGILQQLKLCQSMGVEHLYLGYWIEKCQKMAYKHSFKPLEYYNANRWDRRTPSSWQVIQPS